MNEQICYIYITLMDAVIIRTVQLKELFDKLYNVQILKGYINHDPIEFPHHYQDPGDIELAGFIASALAFGRVDLFKPVIKKVLSLSNDSLYEYVVNFSPRTDLRHFDHLYYRMCKGRDIAGLLFILREVIRRHGSVGSLFSSCYEGTKDIRDGLKRFVAVLREVDTTPVYGERVYPRGLLQLLPSPEGGGPCKRLNMYLRWMVRTDDGIDFGLWKNIPPSILIIPLDTHIIRIGKSLNMTQRKSAGWAMAEDITERFRALAPEDPLKYDFALCHMGISGQWKEWKEVFIDGVSRDTP